MNNTITYKLNGKIYDVPDDKSKDFESQYKDATVAYKVGGKIYDIPVSEKSKFLSDYKDAEYYDDSRPTNIGQDQNTEPATPQQKKQGGFWDTWIGDAIEKLNAGGAMIGKNLFGALDKATQGVEKLGLGTRGGAFKNLSDYFKGVEETSRANSDRYNGKSYSDLWKEGDYAGAIGDIALQGAESLPMSIAAAASTIAGAPIAGLAGIGALTANEKYDQLDAEHPDMDEFAKVTNAILTGTAEGASEMLGAGVSKAWMKTLYKSLGKEKAEEAIKRGLMGQMQKHYKEFGMFYEPIEEGIEEVASQLAENITDKITGVDPDRDITDGLKDSFVYGMGGGAYFSAAGAPGFAKRQYEKLKTRKDLKDARENFRAVFADNEKILGLESELENSTPEEKAVFLTAVNESKQFSPEEKEAIGLLVDADVNYRSWRTPEAVEEEKAERKELAVQTGMINYDNSMVGIIASNGMIQQVYVNGDMQNPVAIIEGDVALTPKTDGTMAIDRGNSSEVLYYKDADGRTIPISPRNVTDVYNVVSAQDQRAQYEANLRAQIDMQEQARAQQRKQEEAFEIENEDSVSYIDPDTGKQVNGIVRDINPGSETMSIEIDGGKLATVPKEIVVKSTIQTVPVQESRDQSVDSPLGNETVTDLRQNAEQPTIEAPVAETAEGPKNGIVTREDGTPDFIASGEESSLDFLAEKYGDKMRRKVEVTKNALNADLEKAQKALLKAEQDYDDAPIGKEDKAEQALRKAQETYDAVKKEADFWTGLNEIVTQEKPGDQIANDIKEMGDPLNGEELAARLLATGAIKLTRDSYKRETGAGNQESKKMFGLFASPEKGGVSIERAGELVMTEDLEAGTNFFDQDDPNAGRNAIIEVLSSARTRGDLINYIKNAREKRAEQEREAEYNEYAAWCEENYHMSPEDYEAYEEDMRKQAQSVSDEAVEYVNGEIVDEIQSIKEEQEEIDAILAQNKNKQNEEIERNDQGRTGGLRERSDQLLQEEQPVQTGRVGEIEQKHAGIDGGVDLTDGVTQESASGEIDENGYPFVVTPDGSSIFGNIKPETGLLPAPIKLSDGFQAEDGRGYGLKHIESRHGDQIRNAGYDSVIDFVQKVANDYEVIKKGNDRGSNETYLLEVQDKHNNTLFIELSKDGSYWNVNSAGIFKKGYSKNKDIVWTLPAVSSNTNTDVAGVNRGHENGETATSGNSPQTISLSDTKDNESASNSKEKTQENETSFEMMNRIAAEQKAKHDISEAEQQVNVNPTEAQKEAGNYKKGHIQIDGFDMSIEQPKGSVRSGKDASGKEWSVTMNNTYGYIRGTEGVDGDHIDVFLSDFPASGRVYVVDQVKDDGSFDEHKVMYGFNSEEEAKAAYLSNYSPGWKGLGNITEVSKDDFKKWIDSSKRKTKPFADYKIANKTEDNGELYKIHSVSDIKNLKTFVSDQLREKGIIEENNPEEYAEIYDDIVNSNQYAEYIGSIISNNDMQYLYDHMPVKTRKQDLIELKSNLSDAGIELEDIVDTRIKRTERKPDRPLESLSDEDNSVIGKTVTIKYFDGTFVKGVIEKLQNGKISVRSLKNGRLYTVNKSAIVEDGSSPDIRFRDSKRGNINVPERVDDSKELIAVHNISEEKLKEALNLGGFPMPSIAITKADVGHTTFGDISLVFDKESINPTDKRNKVYGEDAWTPVFPSVGYKLNSDKTSDIYRRANKAGNLPLFSAVSFHPDNYERYIEGVGSESLVNHFKDDYNAKQLYLSEIGNAVEEYEQHEVEKYLPDQIALCEKVLKEIGIERLKNDSYDAIENDVKQLIQDHYNINFDTMPPFRIKVRVHNTIQRAIDYAENGNKKTENDLETTKKKIDERIDPQKFETWLEDLFSGVVEKKGIRNDRDPFTPSGNRRSWEQLYDKITLDNVVNAMKKQAERGGQGLFGGSIFGSAQEEYKSIDEIRKEAKGRIRAMDEADYKAQRDAITDRLSAIKIPGVGSSFSDTMDMVENIQDAVARSHAAKGIHKYLKESYPKITMETANEIADIVKDIQKMSARYFEAKPYRAVEFNEVRLAVVPSDVDANLVKRLKDLGVEVRTYEHGNEEQRRQIVKEATDEMNLRFRKNQNEVNERFNEKLSSLNADNADGTVLNLGYPSDVLISAGVTNKPLKLYGNKIFKKMKKRGLALSELENLPVAVADPIAVFDNLEKKGNRSVLTELRTQNGNFLVTLDLGKDADVDFNIVSSVFGKRDANIVDWINRGLAKYVNKEKALLFLSRHSAPIAETAANEELSSATKVVESFVNPTLEEGKISSSVEELSESLNTPVHIIRDVNDITDADKELQRQKQGSKGWYDTKTGGVYLVLPNAESVADAQATILHETVAHKGLRGLLGDNFGPTMDSVFDSLPQEVQSGLMDSYGDRVVAAEEYCAEMAETMTDPGIIQKICSAIKEALRKIGVNLKISDGDIMYMLWKSKNRLENSDTAFDIMRKAKTDAMVKEQSREYDNFFRSKKPLSKLGLSDDLQRRIEGKMQSRTELFQEAYVDRMISVKKLQEEVEKAIGKKIPDYMNVYVYENTLSSRNTYEQEQFEQKRIKPLLSAIKDLRDKGYSEREIENYVLAKHGIERNEYMRYAVLEKAIDAIKDETLKQQLLAEIANKKFSDITQLSNKEMDELRDSLGRRDFAGLTGTYADMKGAKDFQSFLKQMEADGKTIADFMSEIENFISDMEISNKIEISNLWDRIRAVNEYSLKKWFDTGMINRKTYDKIKGMYENYVPLRGFAEAQMSDVFDYFSDRDIVYNETVKTAKGRTSRPDSPFAYMASVGDSAIVGGNKNQMKLHLLRMAMDGATDMLTVNKQWYEVGHDANGNEIWTPAYPIYDEDPEVYRKNIEDFEADMLLKKSQGLANTKRGSLTNDLDEKSQKNLDQHAVKVKLNGEEYVVYVNGNPKIAQAVNGLNTPEQTENKFLKGIAWMNREMAANFTTRNPAFILSNLSRDLIWASSTLGVKENGKYQRKFMRNVPKAMKALKNRIKEGEKWKPDPNDPTSVMLDEFLRNGGRTGYTALYNIDKYKNRIEDATKTGKKAEVKRKAEKVFDAMGVLNEWAEDISRFATFMTSRQMGRSLLQSTYDAKEVTVNFNRKGSGAKGNEWFRAFYIFFNAAVQSLNNAYNMAVKNPGKALALAGGYMTAGAIIPLLLQSLGDDDDKEKYMGLPDYVRKNNVCIPLSMFGMDGFLKIPLPIELRAFYGIGDSFIRYIQHYDEGTDALTDATMGLLDLLPLNPAGGASNFVPSYIQPIVESYVTNEDFTGKPIAKITPFNEYDPEYQKVYKSTGVVAVKLSEYLNALAGGDEAKRKFATFKTSSGADLLNPASVEHLFEAYLGGAFTFANQSFKTFVGAPSGLNDFSSRNIPVLNRFYDTGEVDGTMIKVNEKFFKYVDDAKKAEATYRNYEKLIDNSPSLESAEYMKKLDEYEQSDEWKRAEFILDAKDEIGELNEEVKESTDENYVKFLKEEIASKKKEMVDALKGGKVPE